MARTKQTGRIATCTIHLTNLQPNETLHQRALLLKGRITSPSSTPPPSPTYITITSTSSPDDLSTTTFPDQTWPVDRTTAAFSALVLLAPGPNTLHLRWEDAHYAASLAVPVTYIPLLQTPPLHLALLVAADSPALADCPPAKAAGFAAAHASLPAVVAKVRMAAYMAQAGVAEDMRAKGLGRRAFRLEEQWGTDTVSSAFANGALEGAAASEGDAPWNASAKVHVVRSECTMKQLRALRPEELRARFQAALRRYGGPFDGASRTVVAGVVLDAHYSPAQNRVVGEPGPLGAQDQQLRHLMEEKSGRRVALAVVGSQTCWAWPRFVEEVASCLLDETPVLGLAGNGGDEDEYGMAWEACSAGQAGLMKEVARAFGCAPPGTSVPDSAHQRRDWVAAFCPRYPGGSQMQGRLSGGAATGDEEVCRLGDALTMRCLPHFRLPGDGAQTMRELVHAAAPSIKVSCDGGEMRLTISAEGVGLARVAFRGKEEERPIVAEPVETSEYTYEELEARFDRGDKLAIVALALNGKETVVDNAWALFGRMSFVKVPGSNLVLQKRSVKSGDLEEYDQDDADEERKYWEWAAMLVERGQDGKLAHANCFDMRVGCILDGGVLYYSDGHKTHLGPRIDENGNEHHFGGHASEKISLSPDSDIVKIEIHRDHSELVGMRTTLADGTVRGELHEKDHYRQALEIVALEPGPEEKIVGFFGRSDWKCGFNGIQEFGIITAPKDRELPESLYDMDELKNTDGGLEELTWIIRAEESQKQAFREVDEDGSEKGDEEYSDEEWDGGRS